MRTRVALPLGLITLVLLSCASTSPQVPTVLTPEVAAAQNIPPAHIPWVQMNKGQRIDYMVKTVLPKMKKEFQAFDGKRFARMDCGTCHGDSVEEGTFALPNPKLPKLLEPDLFVELSKQRLFGRLILLNAALRKLPCVVPADATRP